jgi:hypothetical protein
LGNHLVGYISLFRFFIWVFELIAELYRVFFWNFFLNSDYCLFKSEHKLVYCCKDICANCSCVCNFLPIIFFDFLIYK